MIQTQDSQTSAHHSGLPLGILAASPQSFLLTGLAGPSDLPQLGQWTSGGAPLLTPWDSGKRRNQEKESIKKNNEAGQGGA